MPFQTRGQNVPSQALETLSALFCETPANQHCPRQIHDWNDHWLDFSIPVFLNVRWKQTAWCLYIYSSLSLCFICHLFSCSCSICCHTGKARYINSVS